MPFTMRLKFVRVSASTFADTGGKALEAAPEREKDAAFTSGESIMSSLFISVPQLININHSNSGKKREPSTLLLMFWSSENQPLRITHLTPVDARQGHLFDDDLFDGNLP